MIKFNIKNIYERGVGAKSSDSFSVSKKQLPFDVENIDLMSDLEGTIEILRADFGVLVRFLDLNGTVELACDRCGKAFQYDFELTETPYREFFAHLPKEYKEEEDQDVFAISQSSLEIDVTEMLRQEILLQMPSYKTCGKSCKGIPKALLIKEHKKEDSPFQALKGMFQEE